MNEEDIKIIENLIKKSSERIKSLDQQLSNEKKKYYALKKIYEKYFS